MPPVIYIDADACPVKAEVYKVAARHSLRVVVVANSYQLVPAHPLISFVAVPGFGAADDYIAEQITLGDLAVTADVPLAARCVAKGAEAIEPKGRLFNADSIGEALAVRNLLAEIREAGTATGGPSPMTPKHRSKFLATLDEAIHRAKRKT